MNFEEVLLGFQVALSLQNLLYVFIGVVIGMVVGILPGLGPAPTIALMLPLTYVLPADSAIVMLAGIYYGAYYGGTITSVLLRLPGEAASVVTVYDGHQMALKGRAGPALGISAIGSFIGGLVAIIGLIFLSPVIAQYAVKLGPPEYAMLAIAGILMVSALGESKPSKNVIVACFGLLIATVGIDAVTGISRFTGGSVDLLRGIDFVAVAMGLFGIGDVLYDLEQKHKGARITGKLGRIIPTKQDMKDSSGAIARGSVIGFVLGLLPGGGGVVSSLASYATEKKVSKHPEEFGKGAIAGVAGPETANNAGSTSSFLPLLSLGIPSNVILALIFGALLIQGITPGPQLVTDHPEIFWGVLASMVVGNLMLLVLSLPLVGLFVNLIRVRIGILSSIIVVVTMVGVYSVNNNVTDMWVMLIFGIVGYLMRKTGYDPGPLALALVLGPLLESSFRQSLLMSDGNPAIFVERPFSLFIVVLLVGVVVFQVIARRRSKIAAKFDDTLHHPNPKSLALHGDEPAEILPTQASDLSGLRSESANAAAATPTDATPTIKENKDV
ncbi:tripartite tricarboxylate transporter permease [Salinibacterium hongtaonis]|uniref:Transporter n=1 Tax=Homoserinimonas hongtaonis TaxID=2079791 RepID=A0A2U1T189_9MICO|nr:tripartite tricarboxylate transporter permease [Salinibacterium hongtaonis]AWB90203.1 transporter [Salinibacterium hongtaonis]PWB97641.1 transporter [Salinibacterium hongtaonis]